MSVTKNKGIFFTVPESVWEELIKLLPGRGERTAFYRAVTYAAINSGIALQLSNKVEKQIKERVEDRIWTN